MTHNDLAIEVVGARTHNLKGIDCRIPHAKVTVVTGPSGAGKSSLAFDTVYAEAQRRFVESMSTYARQFLEQMERPPVEHLRNILPAVALEARNSIKNARSSVGTLTEVHDVLRLLFTHLGDVGCPNGHGPVRSRTAQEVIDEIASGAVGDKVLVLAELPRPAKQANEKLKELVLQGFFRVWQDGEIVRKRPSDRWIKALDPLPLVLGRFRAAGSESLAEAIDEAYRLTGGRVVLRNAEQPDLVCHYGRHLTCVSCGETQQRPVPALFSFNSPLGACPTCQGFGRIMGIDRGRVIPDPTKTLRERPIAPWNSPSYEELYPRLYKACKEEGVSLDVPWQDLGDKTIDWLWKGPGSHSNLDGFFRYLEKRIYKMHVRVLLSRYRAYETCPLCNGRRLRPHSLAVTWRGESISDLSRRSIEQFRGWLTAQVFSQREESRAGYLLDSLRHRLDTLDRVGLDYLTLDRQARTLSGGEAQRIQLAASLGSGLTSTLYVLDEPTIGLHPQDSDRLVSLLRDLAGRGNTVLVVEHDRTLMQGADHVIDLGPRAGIHGGQVMAEGPLSHLLEHPDSLTGQCLRQDAERPPLDRQQLADTARTVEALPRLAIRGARENNLKGFDVTFPYPALVAVTGVSGSGKSTLIENVLHGTYQRAAGVVDVEPGECSALEGFDQVSDVVMVDQRPLGRSSRSNPVTYVKAYDVLRKLFAATPVATARGISPGHFSFNLDLGRCATCDGLGEVEVDMQFMAAVSVTCDTCLGHRFKPEVLAVTYQGRNIFETLELTVAEAVEGFPDHKPLLRRLQPLLDVGLGYLRLGQSTATLSGGEAQRLKLASFLPARQKNRLFLFDEPTTGLHLADIALLHQTLRRLVDAGHGVIVVEHSTDLIEHADWIIDLGPGGGYHGGELLWCGPKLDFLAGVDSPTATELRKQVRWQSD